jgi:hypothetical protein
MAAGFGRSRKAEEAECYSVKKNSTNVISSKTCRADEGILEKGHG